MKKRARRPQSSASAVPFRPRSWRRYWPRLEHLEDRLAPAVFNVATTDDTVGGPLLSLRDALLAADANVGPDTINLPAGTYRLTRPGVNEDAGQTGDLDIHESVTLFGAGVGNTIIDAGRIDRVFNIVNNSRSANVDEATPDVRLFGVTITGGFADVGGGLLNQGGTVKLVSSRLTANEALSSGGGYFNDIFDTPQSVRDGLVLLSNTPLDHNTTAGINREAVLENVAQLALNAAGEVVDAIDSFFDDLTNTFETSLSAFQFPIIGDQLTTAVAPILGAFQTVRTEVHDFLEDVLDKAHEVELPTVPQLLQNAFFLALGGQFARQGNNFIAGPIQDLFANLGIDIPRFSLDLLKDGPDLGNSIDPEDIVFDVGDDQNGTRWMEFRFHLGQRLTIDLPGFDLGVADIAKFLTGPQGENLGPVFDQLFSVFGFNVTATHGIRFDIGWDIRTGVGLSELANQGVYLLSGATENGLIDGPEVEELKIEIEVKGVPTADGSRNIEGQANLGLLSTHVTDGTPPAIKIFSGAGLGLLNTVDTEFDIITDGGSPTRISLDTGGVPLPIPALLLALNGKILEAYQTPLPPVIFTLDFSAIDTFFNPDATSLPSLVLFARDQSISTLEIRGAEGLGFQERQYEDRRGLTLGFGTNTFSTPAPDGLTQTLTATLPAPVDGELYEDPDFTLIVGGQRQVVNGIEQTVGGRRVPIFFTEVLNRDVLTPIESLQIKLQETVQFLVGTTTSFPVSTVTVDILDPDPNELGDERFVLVSHPDPNAPGSVPPLLTILYETDERSSVKLLASVNIRNPDDPASLRDDFPNNQAFFNRLTLPKIIQYANDLTQVFEPSVKGQARVRFHVATSADEFLGVAQQALGIAPGTIGLPKFDYDFVMDVDWDMKNAIKLAYQVLTGQVNPRDLINLDTLLGEIYQISKFQFANIRLDLRDFLQTTFSAVAAGFTEVLDPVLTFAGRGAHDAASLLNKRLPVISDIVDEDVSLRSLFASVGLDDELDATVNGLLTGVDVVSKIPERIGAFLNSDEFRNAVDANGRFVFGGVELIFDPTSPFFFPTTRIVLPTEMSYAIQSAAELGPLNFFRGYVLPDTFQGLPLYKTPFFDITLDLVQPQNVLNLLLGNPINIISAGIPRHNFTALGEFGFDFQQLAFDISAFVGDFRNLRLGYDSTGLERIVGALSQLEAPDFRDLLAGFFIQNNIDAPEIGQQFRFVGSGSIDLSVFEAEGHVRISSNNDPNRPATVGLEVRDPNHDGKLRLDEIRAIVDDFNRPENLFCIFDLVFDVGVEIGGSASITIPTPFGTIDKSISIDLPIGATISLVDLLGNAFDICQPMPEPPPILADVLTENGLRILRLNTGPNAKNRTFGDTNDDDGGAMMTARSDGNRILVSGYGVTDQVYDGPFTRIVAAGSRVNDNLDLSGVVGVPVELSGGRGNDTLRSGSAADTISGGSGDDTITGGDGNDTIVGDTGSDNVNAGLGDDVIDVTRNGGATVTSGGGNDTVYGSRGNDTITATGSGNVHFEGRRGNDVLTGAGGNDMLLGGDGNDTLAGGAGDDVLHGERGSDSVTGGAGADQLFGEEGTDVLVTGLGDLGTDGGSGFDRLVVQLDDTGHVGNLTDLAYTEAGGATAYSDVESLELRTGDGNDRPTVLVTQHPAAVFGGAGQDQVVIVEAAAGGSVDTGMDDDTVTVVHAGASLSVLGGGGQDTLTLDRTADPTPRTGSLTATTVTGLGLVGDLGYDATTERLFLNLGTGDDGLTVLATSQTAVTTINGGDGDDRVTVRALGGPLAVNGNGGDDSVTLVVTVPAAQLDGPFQQLGVDVDSLVVDNRNNASAIHWSLVDRVVFGTPPAGGSATRLIDAVGARRVVFQGSAGGEELTVIDGVVVNKSITVAGPEVAITQRAEVLGFGSSAATEFTRLYSTVAGVEEGDLVSAVVSPDGRFAYVASNRFQDGRILIFEIDSSLERLFYRGDADIGNSIVSSPGELAITPDGRFLYAVNQEGTVVGFSRDAQTGALNQIVEVGGGVTDLDIAPDGTYLVMTKGIFVSAYAIEADGRLTGEHVMSILNGSTHHFPYSVAITPDSQTLYVSASRGEGFSSRGIWEIPRPSFGGGQLSFHQFPVVLDADVPVGVIQASPGGQHVYLFSNGEGNNLPRIYSRTLGGGLIEVGVGATPYVATDPDLVFHPDGQRFFVVADDRVHEFTLNANGTFNTQGTAITPALSEPRSPALDATGRFLFVLENDVNNNAGLNQVSQFDLQAAGGPALVHTYRNGEQQFKTITELQSLVLSPDGTSGYAVSPARNALIAFQRNSTSGALTLQEVYFDGINGARALRDVRSVAISPDGRHVYVASAGDNVAGVYSRNLTTGLLTFVQRVGTQQLTGLHTIQVTPDGGSVVLQGSGTEVLFRNAATGMLTANSSAANVATAPSGVAASNDGRHLYVLSPVNHRLQVLVKQVVLGTTTYPVSQTLAVTGPSAVALSPDGQHLYVGSEQDDAIYVYRRDATSGLLTFEQTVRNGANGVQGLRNLADLTLSPDGVFLFAVNTIEDTLLIFERDAATGRLTFQQRLRNLSGGVTDFARPVDLAVSADGQHVYTLNAGAGPIRPGYSVFTPVVPVRPGSQYAAGYDPAITRLTVTSADGGDDVRVFDAPIPLTLHTAGGVDNVVVSNQTSLTATIFLGSDNDSLDLRSRGDGSHFDIRGEGGQEQFRVSAFGSTSTATLDGGADADTFRVVGTGLSSDLTLVGGAPTGATGDTLLFDPQGVATTPAVPMVLDGSLRVDQLGAGTTNYTSIETVRSLNGPIPVVGNATTAEGQGVLLTAASTLIPFGGAATYDWDLDGDGFFGDATGQTITLSADDLRAFGLGDSGQYTVAVRVTDTQPEFTDGLATLTITNVAPTLLATGPAQLAAGERYTLTLSATDPGNDRVHRWEIDWNDGSPVESFVADTVVATHIFPPSAVGARLLTLRAFDEDGGPYTTTQSVTVAPPPNVAGADRVDEGAVYTLTFENPGNAVVDAWLIAWGDNTMQTVPGTTMQVQHTYTDDTFADIRVQALNLTTGVAIALAPLVVRVQNVAPTLVQATQDGPVAQGSPVTLTATATDPGAADVISYGFDFDGDGLFDVRGGTNSTTQSYSLPGSYLVGVRSDDDDGGASVVGNLEVLVTNVPPVIANVQIVTAQPREATPVLVRIHATDAGGSEDALTYGFDFDNNGSYEVVGDANAAAHTFAENGTYTVGVRVMDRAGDMATGTVDVVVGNAPPTILAAGQVAQADEGSPVAVTVAGADPAGAADPLSYAFDFDNNGSFEASNTTGMASHTFPDDGTFTVPVRVRDDDGGEVVSTLTLTVFNVAPTAAALSGPGMSSSGGATLAIVDQPTLLTLTATDPSASDRAAGFEFTVDWGDGSGTQILAITANNGSGVPASHVYATTGTFVVRVHATDKDDGRSEESMHTIQVNTFGIQHGALIVVGSTGDDTLEFYPGQLPGSVIPIRNGVPLGTFTGITRLEAYGKAGTDTLRLNYLTFPAVLDGGDGRDYLQSGSGPATVRGAAGDDQIYTGAGADQIDAGPGNDTVTSADGNDTVIGGDGNDVIDTGNGDDTIDAGTGNNRVIAGEGNDIVTAAGGVDTIYGFGGNDGIDAGDGNNVVDGGEGDDRISAGGGTDVLTGGRGNDRVNAGGGNDSVQGGDGNDVLLGGSGNDAVLGNNGRDVIIGGLGIDLVRGGAEEDIVIGGTTDHDVNAAALDAILAEWARTDAAYAVRIGHLRDGTAGGLNGAVRLSAATVRDDAAIDDLFGELANDWFFALAAGTNADRVRDRVTTETVTAL